MLLASTVGAAEPVVSGFHFEPRYRESTQLDEAVLQITAQRDRFPSEQRVEKLAFLLNRWRESLLSAPEPGATFRSALHRTFLGASWQPTDLRPLRAGSDGLDVSRLRFSSQLSLGREPFLEEMSVTLRRFSRILTADFQITKMELNAPVVTTEVRYEIVGNGASFYREQRVGAWSLDWEPDSGTTYSVSRWRAHDEVRTRAAKPWYVDVSSRVFAASTSYREQLLHGADYWRTLLDAACGIDIYGHNGVSVGDFDGDGFDDIYVCQAAGLPNRLYRNRGDGTFEDVTDRSGTGLLENTACALFADFDNDGRQDLIVVRASGPLYFQNQGDGRFVEKVNAFQFAHPPQGTFTGAAAADYDRDGNLDIYFCLYVYYQGADQYKYPSPYFAAENGPPNFMMRNNGHGIFRDVTAQCGLDQNNHRYSFCCGWSDYNRDGWPDLYVVNDFGLKNLYHNNGDGTFSDVAAKLGVEDAGAGMSVCWLDYNNDGAPDLYVANMWTAAGERINDEPEFQQDASQAVRRLYRKHAMGNSMFRNDADAATFRNVTDSSQTGVGRWSWSSDSWDFDHDGFADVYIVNGMISGTKREELNGFFWRHVVANSPNTPQPNAKYEQAWKDINELIRSGYTWSGFERNIFYSNNRDGTFADISGAIGLDFLEDGRSFALADFDHDGRPEVLLKNRNAPQLRLMKNTVASLPATIVIRLQGVRSNRDAIGATVTIHTNVGSQTKTLQAGSGFLSQHSKELFFGLGKAEGEVAISVRWPSGKLQDLNGLPQSHRITVTEDAGITGLEPLRPLDAERATSIPSSGDSLPGHIETWLLLPILAPSFSLLDGTGKAWSLSAWSGKRVLLSFRAAGQAGFEEDLQAFNRAQADWRKNDLHLLVLSVNAVPPQSRGFSFPVLRSTDDVAAAYNLLFRQLFDQHRDMAMPTSFLIDETGQVVKIYQGRVSPEQVEKDASAIPRTEVARTAKALPFPGRSSAFAGSRNYLSLGSIFFQRGYVEHAEGYFRAALNQEPESAEARYGIGSAYLTEGRSREARELFEEAVKAKAAYPETMPNAWNNLGLLTAREGDMAKATKYFQQALQIAPEHFVSLQNLGNAYRQQKRWQEAREALEHALTIQPADPEANYSLGMVFAQLDQTEEAYGHLQKALQGRPAYPEALNNLGVLYLRTGRRSEAIDAFEKCIRVAPAFDQSYLNLARVYAIEGSTEKARATLRALLAQHPTHALASKALADLN